MLLYIFFGSTPTVRRMRSAMLPPSRRMPISRCSVPIIGEPMRAASDTASSTTPLARGRQPLRRRGSGKAGTHAPAQDGENHLIGQAVLREDAVGKPLLLAQQTQQQVLRADVAVAQLLGGLLTQSQRLFGAGVNLFSFIIVIHSFHVGLCRADYSCGRERSSSRSLAASSYRSSRTAASS